MGKDLPLIVMVRDPALRAVSHHAMIADKAATPQQRRSRGTAWLGKSVREVAEADAPDFWAARYVLVPDMVPSFLNEATAARVRESRDTCNTVASTLNFASNRRAKSSVAFLARSEFRQCLVLGIWES